MDPQVSIVIPAYNAERFLETTIKSVLTQTYRGWELIIVDDGSSDSTMSIIRLWAEKIPQIRSLQIPNGGVGNARNSGLSLANPLSEYVIFLDADDVWETNTLSVLLERLQGHPESVGAYGLIRFIDKDGIPLNPGSYEHTCRQRPSYDGRRVRLLSLNEPTTFATCIVSFPSFTPGSALLRRSFVELVGGFDPQLPYSEDWDLWLRLSRHGPFQFVDELVLGWRRHETNVSNSSDKPRYYNRIVQTKARAAKENSPQQSRIAYDSFRPSQSFFLREKMRYMLKCAGKGDFLGVLQQLRPAVGHFIRFVKNEP